MNGCMMDIEAPLPLSYINCWKLEDEAVKKKKKEGGE